jgi:hypothetical protein
LSAAKIELIPDAPSVCFVCGAALCLRKQTINLALGNDTNMKCLKCLAQESAVNEATILKNTSGYILNRDCLRKEWVRYEQVEHCPDRAGCIPDICFGEES